MWLNAVPREELARELGISEESISNIVTEYSQNDSTLQLQREMAIEIKKAGIDMIQVASSIRFANAIKRRGANSEAIADFLSALQKQVDLSEITEEQAIKSIIDCAEFCAKEQIPPSNLHKHMQDKYAETERIHSELTKQNEILEASKIQTRNALQEEGLTIQDIGDFRRIREE